MNFRAPFGNEQYMQDQDLTIAFLAERLVEGSLALILGAGVSKGLGLPTWYELTNKCLKSVGLVGDLTEDTPNETILSKIDDVRREAKDDIAYFKIVHDCLYEGVSLDESIFNKDLLIILSTLMIGSKRGKVNEVLNFNFDNVLEYFLRLYGYTTDVITDFPFLSTSKDVTIYHPHGFLPKDSVADFSNILIFGKHSYNKRLGAKLDPWRDLTRDMFERKVCLFIGLSGDDQEINALLAGVDSVVTQSRPTGFWMFGSDIPNKKAFLDNNVIPVILENHKSYPSFLLKICRAAAEKIEK